MSARRRRLPPQGASGRLRTVAAVAAVLRGDFPRLADLARGAETVRRDTAGRAAGPLSIQLQEVTETNPAPPPAPPSAEKPSAVSGLMVMAALLALTIAVAGWFI